MARRYLSGFGFGAGFRLVSLFISHWIGGVSSCGIAEEGGGELSGESWGNFRSSQLDLAFAS